MNHLLGTWRLISYAVIDSAGNEHYTYGEDAIGLLMYDDKGQMSVQICRVNRKVSNNENFTRKDLADLQFIPKDYLAYFGRYEIDHEKEIVRHFIEAHIFPSSVGKIFERQYQLIEDRVILRTLDKPQREVIWQKI
ncbi:MAG: lipocalin-like domain-containing protein [Gammaproteobacteria bacterium]